MQHAPYTLPRDVLESVRLNVQHRLYTDILGYVLHPHIESALATSIDVRIADIGCGTGAWLFELANNSPKIWEFHGLDMSSGQYQQTCGVIAPVNCDFSRTLDACQPIPEDLRGHFDVVNVCLLICGLTTQDWSIAATNVAQLLKPGGRLQWCEGDYSHAEALCFKPGSSTVALGRLQTMKVQMSARHGKMDESVRNLLLTIVEAGLEACHRDVMSSDRIVETRRVGTEVSHEAATSTVRRLVRVDPEDCGMSEDDVVEVFKQSAEELQVGKVYLRWDVHVVIGRKPANGAQNS